MEAKEVINQFYKTELEYNHLKRVNGDTFPIAQCPIKLEIVDKKNSNNFNVQVVKIENVVEEDCKRVVILAKAGCGKTTFCKQYTHLSQNSTDFLFNGQVIHIPLRRLKNYPKQNKPYNLIDVFENEFFSQKSNGKKLAEELFLDYEKNKDKYLFLLDGLDEVDHDIISKESHSMHKCLMDLLKSSAEHYLIVTTRPYISLKDYKFKMELEIQELDYFDIERYIYKFVPENLRQEVLEGISNVAHSLMHTPILLDIICICFEKDLLKIKFDGEDFTLKIANLFEIIIEELWRMYLKKEGIAWYDDHMNSEVLNIKMKKDIEFLEELAFKQNKKNLIAFSREDLTLKNPDLIKSFIFQSEFVGNNQHVYSFAHYYFQDYFAAKYIIRNIEKQEIIDFIRSNKYEERFLHFWKFVAGIADINCSNQFFDLLEQHPRDLCGGNVHQILILSCLNETGSTSSRENRLSDEVIKHLKFVYDNKLDIFSKFCYPFPCIVLDKLLDWDNIENPGFNEFSYSVLENYYSLPCSYLSKLFKIYEKSYETKNVDNIYKCKILLDIQQTNPTYIFNKINENLLQNPEMWLDLFVYGPTTYISNKALNIVLSIIFKKINEAVELNFKIENGTTDENKAILDNYLINLEEFILKYVRVSKSLFIMPDKEEISKCIKASSVFTDIQKLLKNFDKYSDSKKIILKSDLDVELAEILSYSNEISLDRIFKAFETKNEIAKEKILKVYYGFRKDLQKNHIEILKQWMESSEILNENRIRAVLMIWNQDNNPCDLMIHEEVLSFFIYKGANSFLFTTDWDFINKCQKILKDKFYNMAENQRGRILEEMYKFLSSDCNVVYVVYENWVDFLIKTLTLDDFQNAILYLFQHKISIKKVGLFNNIGDNKVIPINLFGKLIAIFNNDFENLNTFTNCDQVFHVLWDKLEKNFLKLRFFSHNLILLKHICKNFKVPDDFILRFLQSSFQIVQIILQTSILEVLPIDLLDWFLNYLQQINDDEDEQILSKMFTNVIFSLGLEEILESHKYFIKINSTLKNKTEPNFLEPLENMLKKCQKLFPNYHNDLSIYFRFHSFHERNAYLQKTIDSCSNYKLEFGENLFLVNKNAILGFLKIEIVSNIKFCIDDFKSLLEKELKNFELVHLDLSKNKLTDWDVFNIVTLIKENTKLESIILSHNEITHKGLIDLLHDIKSEIHSLKCLFLDFNLIMLRQEDIDCIPEGISDTLERVDLSMNFIPKKIWDKLTDSPFSIYNSYYNDMHASIFPMSQGDWQHDHEGTIALVYKTEWIPSHVFILMDQINKEIGQRTITKADLITFGKYRHSKIGERDITDPNEFLEYIKKLKNKKHNCRAALLTKDEFKRLHDKIKNFRSRQQFRDYKRFPLFFGSNCVTTMRDLLKEVDIDTKYIISAKRNILRRF